MLLTFHFTTGSKNATRHWFSIKTMTAYTNTAYKKNK